MAALNADLFHSEHLPLTYCKYSVFSVVSCCLLVGFEHGGSAKVRHTSQEVDVFEQLLQVALSLPVSCAHSQPASFLVFCSAEL